MNFNFDIDPYTYCKALFLDYTKDDPYLFRERWLTDVSGLPDFGVLHKTYTHQSKKGIYSALLKIDNCWVLITSEGVNSFEVLVSSKHSDEIPLVIQRLKRFYVESKPPDENQAAINFWSHSVGGGNARYRKILVPKFEDIQYNYPTRVRQELQRTLNRDYLFDGNGKLLLWTGKPGTGKTYAIRTLLQNLQKVDYHYILDPENFFGPDSNYMMSVLLSNDHENPFDEGNEPTANLLILEDVGELISSNAKTQTGQGFARLLNVTEGLIGQGLNLLILMTSNDEVKNFHEAIFRNGRCKSQLQFDYFSREESKAWLEQNQIDYKPTQSMPLSDLYALRNGGDSRGKEEIRAGF